MTEEKLIRCEKWNTELKLQNWRAHLKNQTHLKNI
jgi:hypothetical protein